MAISANENEWPEVFRQAREGSREALGQILEEWRLYLFAIARQKMGRKLLVQGEAADFVQECFLEAQRNLAAFQGTKKREFGHWLRSILIHNLLDACRRCPAARVCPLHDNLVVKLAGTGPSPVEEAIANESTLRLQLAMSHLTRDYREVVLWHLEEDKSFAEIGHLIHRSSDAARKLWCRARQHLRIEA